MGQTSESAKRLWEDPVYRHRVIEATALGKAEPESVARRSQAARNLWKDPEYLRKMANKPPPPNKLSEQERVQKTCPVCGCTFSVLPCKVKRITCSKECRKARKIKRGAFKKLRKCEACQQEFAPLNHRQTCCKVCVPTHIAGSRWRLFRLTQQMYDAMLVVQENACKLCRVPFAQLANNQIHLDHNHETNQVRGILCQRCNLFVGLVESSRHFLQDVLRYTNVV